MATKLDKPVTRLIADLSTDRCPHCGTKDETGGHKGFLVTIDAGGIVLRAKGKRTGQRLPWRQVLEAAYRFGYQVRAGETKRREVQS